MLVFMQTETSTTLSKPVCSLRMEIPFKSTCGEFPFLSPILCMWGYPMRMTTASLQGAFLIFYLIRRYIIFSMMNHHFHNQLEWNLLFKSEANCVFSRSGGCPPPGSFQISQSVDTSEAWRPYGVHLVELQSCEML